MCVDEVDTAPFQNIEDINVDIADLSTVTSTSANVVVSTTMRIASLPPDSSLLLLLVHTCLIYHIYIASSGLNKAGKMCSILHHQHPEYVSHYIW